jgi:hypothetical protein
VEGLVGGISLLCSGIDFGQQEQGTGRETQGCYTVWGGRTARRCKGKKTKLRVQTMIIETRCKTYKTRKIPD